jgi:hypothetical protein
VAKSLVAGQLEEVAVGGVDHVLRQAGTVLEQLPERDRLLVGRDARKPIAEAIGEREPAVLDQGQRRRQGQVLGDRPDVKHGPRCDPDPPRPVCAADAA